jgi:hypothetical protein
MQKTINKLYTGQGEPVKKRRRHLYLLENILFLIIPGNNIAPVFRI